MHTTPHPPPSSQEPEGVRPAPGLPGSRAPGRRGRGVARSGGCVSPVSAPGFRSHQLPSGSAGVSPSGSEAPARRRRFAPLSPRRARLRKLLQPVSVPGPAASRRRATLTGAEEGFFIVVAVVVVSLLVFVCLFVCFVPGSSLSIFLVVQWLRFRAPNAGSLGSIPGQETGFTCHS